MPTSLMTEYEQFRKMRAVNCTDTSFDATAVTATEPSGDAGTATGQTVISSRGGDGVLTKNLIELMFFGEGADNATYDVFVGTWEKLGRGETACWAFKIIAKLSCTLCTYVGLAGKEIINTERFVDTVTVSLGNAGVDISVISNAADRPAVVRIDYTGSAKIELIFDMTGATSGNAFYKFL